MNNSKIPYDIRALSRIRAVNFYEISKGIFTDEIKPGQIWSTHSSFQLPNGEQFQTDEPRLIVILEGSGKYSHKLESITTAPLSLHTSMASEHDFIVEQKSGYSSLPFDFIVEIWNETPALKGQLNKLVSSLTTEATELVSELYLSRLLDDKVPEHLIRHVGFGILAEDDPRKAFQENELIAMTYLAKPATAALEIDLEEATESKALLTFEAKPFLGKLSDYLTETGQFVVAHAANNINSEEESWLFVSSEKNKMFVFELLNNRQEPYSIYLKSHLIAPNIINHSCIVYIQTKDYLIHSPHITLQNEVKIEVGQDPNFRSRDVEYIKLIIEEE